jgi:acyl-CoA synthetase (AMP-forming)/AMP-acid ligase II
VVLHEGKALTEQDVIDLCATTLGGYKKPTVVELQYDPLPRTPVGKIPRKQIRERYWGSGQSRIGGS